MCWWQFVTFNTIQCLVLTPEKGFPVLKWVHCAMQHLHVCSIRNLFWPGTKWFMDEARNNASLMTWISPLFSQIIQRWAEKSPSSQPWTIYCFLLSKSSLIAADSKCRSLVRMIWMCVPYQPHAWHPMISESLGLLWLYSNSNSANQHFISFHWRHSLTCRPKSFERISAKRNFGCRVEIFFLIILYEYEVESCWFLPHYEK